MPVFSTTLTYDQAGRITGKTETVQGQTDTYHYGYDPAGRLSDVSKNGIVTAQYQYDPNGNRSTVTYGGGVTPITLSASHDDQDRLTNYGGTTYSYTANGELQSKTQNGQTTHYTYDGDLFG